MNNRLPLALGSVCSDRLRSCWVLIIERRCGLTDLSASLWYDYAVFRHLSAQCISVLHRQLPPRTAVSFTLSSSPGFG